MKLQECKQIDGYRFYLKFDDGVAKEVNLQDLISNKVNDSELSSAMIDSEWGCLEFKNGLVDIEPKTLYKYVLQAEINTRNQI